MKLFGLVSKFCTSPVRSREQHSFKSNPNVYERGWRSLSA